MYPGGMLGQLAIALEKLGWEYGDEVDVEIGGTSVSGLMLVRSTTRSGNHLLELANITKMHSSSSRIESVDPN